MSDFRKLAHLEEQLGDERFQALIDSDNTGRVKDFCDGLAKAVGSALPTEMTVGGRVYEILSFLREEDGGSVRGDVMVSRAKELGANLGKEDCEFILAHQADIPVALRGKVTFVFPDWRHPDDRESVAYVDWRVGGWCQGWGWLSDGWYGHGRLLRRK